MALNTRISTAAKQAGVNAITALLGAGAKLRIYSGAQPASPDAAVAGTLLVELALSADAFADADANGTAAANAITNGNPVANGTAGWCTLVTSGGTRIIDGSVGTADANLVLGSTTIAVGVPVSISSLLFSLPTQGA